jgi:AbrB family looped-hinge helix DNA binding protein
MNTTGKIQNKGQVTIPTAVRRQAGLSKGDLVNFAFQRGKIVITPRTVIDRSQFRTADDEYTPEQRRIIDARLAKAEADIRAGRVHGPFKSAGEAIKFLHREIGSRCYPPPPLASTLQTPNAPEHKNHASLLTGFAL